MWVPQIALKYQTKQKFKRNSAENESKRGKKKNLHIKLNLYGWKEIPLLEILHLNWYPSWYSANTLSNNNTAITTIY